MRYLRLRLRFPREARHPMHQYITEGDGIRRAYLRHWNFSNPEYVTTLFQIVGSTEQNRDGYIAALDAVETITHYDVTSVDDRNFYVYLTEAAHGHGRRFRDLLADTDLLVVPPIEYGVTGNMIFEVAGDNDELQALVAGIPEHLSVSVDRLGEYDANREPSVAALTDRQQEVLAVARDLGYYEIPRQTSVREIADRLRCSKSTAANHLRKIESRLVTLHEKRSIPTR